MAKISIENLNATVEALVLRVEQLEAQIAGMSEKKGPSSTREMTLEDAERIINGDLKDASHKAAAEALGLSYGQIYSARGGYTFKSVKKNK